jgi:hypothetical protein
MNRSSLTLGVLVLLAGAAAGGPAYGQEAVVEKTQVHGFGRWHYGRTSEPNLFLGGTPDGQFDNSAFALHTNSQLSSRLAVATQLEAVVSPEGLEMELDFAFASWKFSDAAVMKAGSVKLPFGIWTEVFDVGTVRPFIDLPRSVYGPVGTVGERYQGAGLSGAVGESWRVRYDAFFGGLNLEENETPELVLLGEEEHDGEEEGEEGEHEEGEHEEAEEEHQLRNTIGGRMVFETPVSGLSFGFSAYSGIDDEHGGRRSAWGGQVEYLSGPWALRSEYVGGTQPDDDRKAVYFEAARRFGRWELAGRYEWFKATLNELDEDDDEQESSLLRHESFSVGLNYWFSPEFVLKANFHRVDGNRLAAPEADEIAELFEAGLLNPKTSAFQIGAQFSF